MSGLLMFQCVFTFLKYWLCDDILKRATYWRPKSQRKTDAYPHFATLHFRKRAKMNLHLSVRHVPVWKGVLYWGRGVFFLAFFFSNETRKRRKPSKSGEKQSQSVKEKNNPPVSSEAEALQGSFSNNCTMFYFPLKDYISALQSIHSDWKHLINRNVFNCVERPWLMETKKRIYIYSIYVMYL